ncbi:MAG: adenylate/guanylate cyclase domain-containing protein [Actinobacteria bacterium]|nr:adenylate/guanylate cyclase domain-containing protein [Actinomycetota bacterium]
MNDPVLRQKLSAAVVGEPVYTVDELMEATGTPRALADELWLALGFPLAGADDSARIYCEIDVEALRSLNGLLSLGLVDHDALMSLTRVMGQAMARLSSAEAEIFDEVLRMLVSRDADGLLDEEAREAVIELLVPGVERFVTYTWRRHLLASMNRRLDTGTDAVVVGFVDLVDFTKTTRRLPEEELAGLVARFERHVYETVTNSGARLRKLLGDGVMFDAPDAATAAGAALALVMRCAEDPHMEGARGGLAAGGALELEGDLYGETVNRSSRLSALAYPNTVLADRAVGDEINGQAGFSVKRLGSRSVRGLGRVDISVIRATLL